MRSKCFISHNVFKVLKFSNLVFQLFIKFYLIWKMMSQSKYMYYIWINGLIMIVSKNLCLETVNV